MAAPLLGNDRERFRRLFMEQRGEVYRFLYRLAGNAHDAEDLLQETFARLWHKRDQYRGDGSLAGYIRKIAYRTFLNARTRLQRVRAPLPITGELEDRYDGPADDAQSRDCRAFLLRHVQQAVRSLPESWRQPFVLFRYENMSCREIAELMGLTNKAVEMRLRKATRSIAAQLASLRAEYDDRAAR